MKILVSTQTETPCLWWNLACPLQAPLYLGIETITKRNQTKTLWLEEIYSSSKAPPPCVYCGLNSHRSSDCTKVLDIASRREYLTRNKLCYSCARSGHLASNRNIVYADRSCCWTQRVQVPFFIR